MAIEQAGSVIDSARPEFPLMLVKVEVATLAHLWKLFVQVAVLDDSADAKVRMG